MSSYELKKFGEVRGFARTCLLILAIVGSSYGCATMSRIVVDPKWEQELSAVEIRIPDRWLIDDRLNISFGLYQVLNADRGWTQSVQSGDATTLAAEWLKAIFVDDPFALTQPSIVSTRTKLSYTLSENMSDSQQVRCAYATHGVRGTVDPKDLPRPPLAPALPSIPSATVRETVYARFKCISNDAAGFDQALVLDILSHRLTRGVANSDAGTLRIERSFSSRMARSDGLVADIPVRIPIGYEIFSDERRVGAVVTEKRAVHRVFMAKDLDEKLRRVVAQITASLMLFDMAFEEP